MLEHILFEWCSWCSSQNRMYLRSSLKQERIGAIGQRNLKKPEIQLAIAEDRKAETHKPPSLLRVLAIATTILQSADRHARAG